MVIGLYTASGKITVQVFLGLVAQADAAIKALLVAIVNLGAAVLVFVGAGYVTYIFLSMNRLLTSSQTLASMP